MWLNAGSALSYGSSFNETSREVSLSGEAYFEVARHAALPFRVEARGCTFTVLGTKFDISAYAEDPAVTAALLEGALRFESEDKQEAMTPGDLVTYDATTFRISLSSAQNIKSVMRALCDILPISVSCEGCRYVVDALPQ